MSETLWLEVSKIAHALASRHDAPSYYRPQYIASLIDALEGTELTDIRQTITQDLFRTIETQCEYPIAVNDYDMFWHAFGLGRCSSGVQVLQRSRAARNLDILLANPSLPAVLVEQARALAKTPNPFVIKVLRLGAPQIAERLYRNPLDPYQSLLALCAWRLDKNTPEVETLSNWVHNVVYHQVRYRVVIGRLEMGDMEDIFQDVLVRILEQLGIYQPQGRVTLSNWTFTVVNQSISMSVRSLRREHRNDLVSSKLVRHEQPGSLDDVIDAESSALVEYAMTRLRESGVPNNIEERIKIFINALPSLLGGEAPHTQAELAHQLQLLIPTIDSTYIRRILAHSGLARGTTQGEL
jgi:DNA-directed RNA polymerase specialized sigma24 family protein